MDLSIESITKMLGCVKKFDGYAVSYACFGCPAFEAWNDTDEGKTKANHFSDLSPTHSLYCNVHKCCQLVAEYLIDLSSYGDDDAIDLISCLVYEEKDLVYHSLKERMIDI